MRPPRLYVLLGAISCLPLASSAEDSGSTSPGGFQRAVLPWQAALEARGFSPGLVDGIAGSKTTLATRAFQVWAGLEATGTLTPETSAALGLGSAAETAEYRILPEDALLVCPCPPDWNERSRRKRLLYPTLSNCLAERFHTSERCLAALNPGTDLASLAAGATIVVPALRERATVKEAVSLEIDLGRKLVLLVGEDGRMAGLLHCSVAKDVDSVERGETRVLQVVEDPSYTFDPAKWPEVRNVKRRLLIPPGPRSPVGIRWIGLERAGVGIHGTAEPENIGKTGSHGCFRLTNWDAAWLASVVVAGARVTIHDRAPAAEAISSR